jgi:alkylation response protein AidB-like acyl-CoA dehydrogenase
VYYVGQAALDCALEYSVKREAFGSPISKLQGIQVTGAEVLQALLIAFE